MIAGLAGEKDRWTLTVADLSVKLTLVIGDSLVSAGAVSYSGSFTSLYREDLEAQWRDALEDNQISFSD
jgi:dynein heavy chain